MDNLIGRVLGHGKYRLERLLGGGGQGTVYLATHLSLGVYVAVKVLPPAFASDPLLLGRFEREARRLAQLRHASIVAVYDYASEDGLCYIVSEYVQGSDLRQLLHQQRGALPHDQALRIMREIGAALEFVHSQGVIHRDIKPGNILVEATTGRAVLCDFGLARQVAHESLNVTMAWDGSPGTPAYMSLEQRLGQTVDHRTDIYSFALVCYEMLIGQHPVLGSPQARAALPPAARAVLEKSLSEMPDARHQSVSTLVREVERALGGGGGLGPGPSSKKLLPLVGAAIAVLAVLIAALASRSGPREARVIAPVTVAPTSTVRPTDTAVPPPTADLALTTVAQTAAAVAQQPTAKPTARPTETKQAVPTATRSAVPSDTPAPTATPRPDPVTGTVNAGTGLAFRVQPSFQSALLYNLPNHAQVTVLGKNEAGDWLYVLAYRDQALTGWVASQFVTVAGNLGQLPVIASAPAETPTPVLGPFKIVPPTLLSPANGYASGTNSFELAWSAENQGSSRYRLIVAWIRNGQAEVHVDQAMAGGLMPTMAYLFEPDFSAEGEYRWKVQVVDAQGEVLSESEEWTFWYVKKGGEQKRDPTPAPGGKA